MTATISLGSISHSTLRTEDLLEAFADELEYQVTLNAEWPLETREGYTKLVWDAREADPAIDAGYEIVDELMQALNEIAPPYVYFGSHVGDGADFGFWPDFDSLDMAVFDGEVIKVDDLSQANEPGEYMLVNDHGNVTLGYIDQSGDFHETWSCV